jgi:hypothetical protein
VVWIENVHVTEGLEKNSNQVLDTLELMGAVHALHSRALDKGNHAVYGVKADELRQTIALNKP